MQDESSNILKKIYQICNSCLIKEETKFYGEVLSELGWKNISKDKERLGEILDLFSLISYKKFNVFLSSVVIRTDHDYPGNGYFKLLKSVDESRYTGKILVGKNGNRLFNSEMSKTHEFELRSLRDNTEKIVSLSFEEFMNL